MVYPHHEEILLCVTVTRSSQPLQISVVPSGKAAGGVGKILHRATELTLAAFDLVPTITESLELEPRRFHLMMRRNYFGMRLEA